MSKINIPELEHYVVGGIVLLLATPPLMQIFPVQLNNLLTANYVAFAAAWIFLYSVVDQILHVVIKHEKISIVQ